MKGTQSVRDVIVRSECGDIVPSNILLSGAELEFNKPGREFLLKVGKSGYTSSLYNSANIVSGLASGMDTEGMIESLVQSYSAKITQLRAAVASWLTLLRTTSLSVRPLAVTLSAYLPLGSTTRALLKNEGEDRFVEDI